MTATVPADDVVTQWRHWLASVTDSLLALDAEGAPGDPLATELPTLFIWRKLVADRIEQLAALPPAQRSGAAAAAVHDADGAVVGASLRSAAEALDQRLHELHDQVDAQGERSAAATTAIAELQTGVELAKRKAAELGMLVAAVSKVAGRAEALRAEVTRIDHVTEYQAASLQAAAAELADLRRQLDAAGGERDRTLAQVEAVPARLATLSDQEARVRTLADACRAKVVQCPPLAVPSVDHVQAQADQVLADSRAGEPWPVVRGAVGPLLARLDRLSAALNEAERRFQEPLAERDRLRGLVQAFRDKAAARGRAEDPQLEPLYRAAEAVLWHAPSDLIAGAAAVDAYIAAVNTAQAPLGHTRDAADAAADGAV